ncbi:WD repeat-containing protein 53-like [Glandiceps talaboti]
MASSDFTVQVWNDGHTDTILCLDSSTNGVTASGGQDGRCCLWTSEGKVINTLDKFDEDITSICFCQKDSSKFYLSSGNHIQSYDLKNLKEPVCSYSFNQEEINQITLNSNEELLASCDDAGQIKVINLREKKVHRTLRRHSNICTSVKFRRKKQWELVSGAMDECIIHWESGRGQVLRKLNMQEYVKKASPGEMYLVNPPLIHCVDISRNDRLLVCALENATVQVFEFQGKKGIQQMNSLIGHTQGVSQVHFPRMLPNDWLLSAGNDGKILLWDVSVQKSVEASHQDGKGAQASDNMDTTSEQNCLKLQINHNDKINWISSMHPANKDFVLIADQSPNISAYHINQ